MLDRVLIEIDEVERNYEDESENLDRNEETELGYLNSLENNFNSPLYITVFCNNVSLRMEIDSGACTSVIHMNTYNSMFSQLQLKSSGRQFRVVSGQNVNVVGYIDVLVRLNGNGKEVPLLLYVITGDLNFTPLFGRPWLDAFFGDWRKKLIENVNILNVQQNDERNDTEEIFKTFDSVFSETYGGPVSKFKADIVLKDESVPIFCKPYTVPFGLRDRVEEELERLQQNGVIYPVRYSRWASPIVPVEKTNGQIRICVDCKVTINRFINTDHYPLPRCDDIFAQLADCVYFCVLDLEGAYQQVEVSEQSQELLTINTHKGLFRYSRLIFGVKSAPAIFQSIMDTILNGAPKTQCYLDDIIIAGSTYSECKRNLYEVLTRLKTYRVKVNAAKCKLFKTEIEFLGHGISKGNIRPGMNKLEAIKKAPRPENLTQLRWYLGFLNYYSHFIPNLSTELAPLYELTRKGVVFKWSDECENCFIRSKDLLSRNHVLVLYDSRKPIVLQCDASPYGVGAVLSHVIDGVQRPILFASSTLTKAEQNYSQLHREALAIIFGVKKFHKYIYGKLKRLV